MFTYNSAPPSALEDLAVLATTNSSVTLSWVLGFNGNSGITSVIVDYVTQANFQNYVSGNVSFSSNTEELLPNTGEITGLEAHTQYLFTVTVVNGEGTSPPSSIQEWTLPDSE